MGNNPAVAIIAAIVLIVAVVWIASSVFNIGGGGGGPSDDTFFYDTQTKKLFGALPTEVAPIEAPSGAEGVLAYVFKKKGGDCKNADDRFIAYLWRHPDPEAVKAAVGAIERGLIMNQADVRREDESDWVPRDSAEGDEIIREFPDDSRDRCMEYRR